MPGQKGRPRGIPGMTCHRASGQAVVRLSGRDIYCGPYGSPEAKSKYDEAVARWLAHGRCWPREGPSGAAEGISVAEMLLAYLAWADGYYKPPSREPEALRLALRPLRQAHALDPAASIGPRQLKGIRESLVASGLSRPEINRRIGRIVRCFRWAVEHEIVPPDIHARLAAVAALRLGRTEAPDHPPVAPVPDEHVDAVLPLLTPEVRAIIEVMRYSGARGGEVVQMTTRSIDISKDVWRYRPPRHKNAHRGKDRTVYLGPRAQSVLRPWLRPDAPDEPLFSPRAAMMRKWGRLGRRKGLKSAYASHGVSVAVGRACDRAGVPHWHPHQLRHSAATRIRHARGIEGAQHMLGHTSLDVTNIYAERRDSAAEDIARELG